MPRSVHTRTRARTRTTRSLARGILVLATAGVLAGPPAGAAPSAVPAPVSVSDTSLAEAPGTALEAVFTVSIVRSGGRPVSVTWETQDGSASAGLDYAAASGTLELVGNQTAGEIRVAVADDALDEDDETFAVRLTDATDGAVIVDDTGVATVADDDATPTVGAGDAAATEGEPALVPIALSAPSGRAVTVTYATADGSAAAGSDFDAAAGKIVIPAGETATAVSIATRADGIDEEAETFTLNLAGAVNATVAAASATVTIADADAEPLVSVADATVTEGPAGATIEGILTVRLSTPSAKPVSVRYASAAGTATAGVDYVETSGSVTFAAGTVEQRATVTVKGDALDEDDETFVVSLSDATNAAIGDGVASATITDDDAPPAMTIDDDELRELEWLASPMEFRVRLTAPSAKTVAVAFATGDGSATAGVDYVATSGTVVIAPGQTTGTARVSIKQDQVYEGNETYFVRLSSPQNATVADGEAVGTILDDDPAPELRVSDATTAEGNEGSTMLTFTVALSGATAKTATVQYRTIDTFGVHATAGEDYVAASGTLTFAPGETAKAIDVQIFGDVRDEYDETVGISLFGATNASIADFLGIGAILDDDELPAASIDDVTVNEGNSGTTDAVFTVSLSAPSGRLVSIKYATANGTAFANGDYLSASGTLSFASGETSRQVVVKVVGDTRGEMEETFTVKLTAPSFATLARATGTGTILADDPALVVEDATAVEADDPGDASDDLRFTVRLISPPDRVVLTQFTTQDGTARGGNDFVTQTGLLVFEPGGPAERTVTVPVLGNERADAPVRTMSLLIHFPNGPLDALDLPNNGAEYARERATGTIVDDEGGGGGPSYVRVAPASGSEGDPLVFEVFWSGPTLQPALVPYVVFDRTATFPGDFVALAGATALPPGPSSALIVVPTLEDLACEGSETFEVQLVVSVATPAEPANSSATGTILDDDC